MAAAGYRLGFKGPFAPLKKQQLPLDPRFVRHGDTPTSTPKHSTSPLKTHSHTLFTPAWIHRAWRPPARAGKRKLLVFVIVLFSIETNHSTGHTCKFTLNWKKPNAAVASCTRRKQKKAHFIIFHKFSPMCLNCFDCLTLNVLMKMETFDGQGWLCQLHAAISSDGLVLISNTKRSPAPFFPFCCHMANPCRHSQDPFSQPQNVLHQRTKDTLSGCSIDTNGAKKKIYYN